MRHRNSGRKLGRTSSHRKALMQNLCNSLIEHELIKTTLPKAKELRSFIEPMITNAKEDSLASRRTTFDRLRSRDSVMKLFNSLGPRFEKRPGGYTRIIKCGFRAGDNAPMAIIELVDRNNGVAQPEEKPKKAKAAAPKAKAKTEAKEKSKTTPETVEEVAKPKKAATKAKKKAENPEA